MARNPWTLERLQSFLNAEEHASLEFKSTRGLLDDKNRHKVVDDLCGDITGFLNGEGGLLIIGLDEGKRELKPDVATRISAGIPRRALSASVLENMICSRIHPAVAGLIKVFPIRVDQTTDDELLAFAVEIAPGITAYQAPDKKYYVRRGYATEAMEDKDIRLRMLNNQVARASVTVTLDTVAMLENLKGIGAGLSYEGQAPLIIQITNTGLISIRQIGIKALVRIEGHSVSGEARGSEASAKQKEYWLTWPDDANARHAIHPEDTREIPLGILSVNRESSRIPAKVTVSVACYLEDAPAVNNSQDLTESYLEGCARLEAFSNGARIRDMQEIHSAWKATQSADPEA